MGERLAVLTILMGVAVCDGKKTAPGKNTRAEAIAPPGRLVPIYKVDPAFSGLAPGEGRTFVAIAVLPRQSHQLVCLPSRQYAIP